MLKRKKRHIRIIVLTLLILLIVSAALIIIKTKKPDKYTQLQDKCSIILGSLLHQIKDEASCRINCRNYCETQGLDYSKINFVPQQEKCNFCGCYCK